MATQTEKCPWCNSLITRSEFERISASIREEEEKKAKDQVAQIERKYRSQLEQERKQAAAAACEVEQKKAQTTIKELTEKNKKLKEEMEQQAEAEKTKDLADQRTVLERSHQKELARRDADHSRQLEKLTKQFEILQRQVQKETANDLGDGAEIDLYESLRDAFPDDHFTRIPKGHPGADIHQQVMYKGRACGLIVYDAKNRQSWQRTFLTKLREDKIAAKADHAILATRVFPSGHKELCIEDEVVLINPGRAVHLVCLLRTNLVKSLLLGLSQTERKEKMDQLYRHITSEQYVGRFAEIERLTTELLELDAQEFKVHQNTWKKRGQMTKRVQALLTEIDTDISTIVEGAPPITSDLPDWA